MVSSRRSCCSWNPWLQWLEMDWGCPILIMRRTSRLV